MYSQSKTSHKCLNLLLLYQICIYIISSHLDCISVVTSPYLSYQVDQVQEVLPHIHRGVIEQDLRRTANPLATIDNLLQSTHRTAEPAPVQPFRVTEPAPLQPEEPRSYSDELPDELPALLPPSPQLTSTNSVSSSNLAALQDSQNSDDDVTIRRRRVLQAVERRLEFPEFPRVP